MSAARWVDLLAQWIFHGLVAALLVEALVRLWRVQEPGQRLLLRLAGLCTPLLVFPLLALRFPGRLEPGFRDRWALFDGRHWDEIRILGVGLYPIWIAVFASAGGVLFLLDLRGLLRPRRPCAALAHPEPARRVLAQLAELAPRFGLAPPELAWLEEAAPVFYCTGLRRPRLVLSRGAVELLDSGELRAALAHELGHLARRDPALGWVLLGVRALLGLNPAGQVLARAMARDLEWRADEAAAAATGDRLALASGLLRLYRARAGTGSGVLARARALDIEIRCRRLLAPAPERVPFGTARAVAASLALAGLLFFVV